jgi:hypothetical protein
MPFYRAYGHILIVSKYFNLSPEISLPNLGVLVILKGDENFGLCRYIMKTLKSFLSGTVSDTVCSMPGPETRTSWTSPSGASL